MPESVKKKGTRAKRPAGHPPFSEMIRTAITDIADKKGSSRIAIKKYILDHFNVEDTKANNSRLNVSLRRGIAGGKLTTARHHAGHFKVPKPGKRAAGKSPKKKTPKKKSADKTTPKKAEKAKSPVKKAVKALKKTPKKSPAKKVGRPKGSVKKVLAKKPTVKKAAKK